MALVSHTFMVFLLTYTPTVDVRLNYWLPSEIKEDTYLVDDVQEASQVHLSCEGNKITTDVIKAIITEFEEPVVLICGTHGYATMIQQVCEENQNEYFVF